LVLSKAVLVPQILNLLGQVAEEEDVFFANLAGDFDLGGLLETRTR
jgi:hypothetical protein